MKPFIKNIEGDIEITFSNVSKWFFESKDVQLYVPINKGWSISQILEHITLTNHYLLILIEKGVRKSLSVDRSTNFETLDYSFDNPKLDEVGMLHSFEWNRPEHMIPKGKIGLLEVQNTLLNQKNRTLELLRLIPDGEGLRYKITMTVNDLGKINVYDYIRFLLKHSDRHIQQMEACKNEYLAFQK